LSRTKTCESGHPKKKPPLAGDFIIPIPKPMFMFIYARFKKIEPGLKKQQIDRRQSWKDEK